MTVPFTSSSDRTPKRAVGRTALAAALIGGLVVAPAILTASTADAVAVTAPAAPGVQLNPTAGTKAPSKLTVTSKQAGGLVTLSVLAEAVGSSAIATGTVTLMEGEAWLGDLAIAAGRGSKVLPKLSAGEHTILVNYTGDANILGSQTWYTLVVTQDTATPAKASSRLKASFKKLSKHRLKAKVTVTTAARLTGRIEIRSGSKVVAKGAIKSAAGAGTKSTSITLTTKKLKKGTRKLTIRYLGSPTIKASSKSYRVRVR